MKLRGLLIQIVALQTALQDHRFGILGRSLVGLVAGALSGYFLQVVALTVVTGSGSLNEPRLPEVYIIQGLTGAVMGAVAMAAVGILLNRRSSKS